MVLNPYRVQPATSVSEAEPVNQLCILALHGARTNCGSPTHSCWLNLIMISTITVTIIIVTIIVAVIIIITVIVVIVIMITFQMFQPMLGTY